MRDRAADEYPPSNGALCASCGADRSDEPGIDSGDRRPCPSCGAMGVDFFRTATGALQLSATVSVSYRPGRQERDWEVRWMLLPERAARLRQERRGSRGEMGLHAAAQDYADFFVLAYHFKDALVSDGVVNRLEAERAITASPTLALLADLANLDKHRRLDRSPRTGTAPSIEIADQDAGSGWVPLITIVHGNDRRDGAEFVDDVLLQWRQLLQAWGLIA